MTFCTVTRTLAVAGSLAAAGCWPDYDGCPYGTLPVSGATGVPLDAVIELRATDLPDDLPSLEDAVGLLEVAGGEVPVDVEIDRDVVRMIPRAELKPDTEYLAWGIDEEQASDAHWWGDLRDTEVALTFSTGGQPAVSAVTRADPGRGIAVMAFTEPVDLDTLAQALTVGRDVEAEVLGYHPHADTLVEVRLEPLPDVLRMALREGATTPDGRAVAPSGGWIRVHRYPDELVAQHRGEGVCP